MAEKYEEIRDALLKKIAEIGERAELDIQRIRSSKGVADYNTKEWGAKFHKTPEQERIDSMAEAIAEGAPADLLAAVEALTDKQRVALFSPYCKNCGCADPYCFCSWDDPGYWDNCPCAWVDDE